MPDPIRVAISVDRFVRRIHENLHPPASAADTHKIGPWGGMILMTLAEIEPAPTQELTRRMTRDKSQMTRKLSELERKGLIARAPSPDDGRVTLVRLTPEGRTLLGALQAVLGQVIEDLLRPLAPQERANFAAYLDKL